MRSKTIDLDRFTHGLKTALACLLGFAITKSLHFYVDQWLIITIIVVMCAQLSVGSMLQKSYMRFLGTLSGSIFAAFVLLVFGQDEIVFAVSIALSVMVFSYIATGQSNYNESGTLGAATVVIILISNNPTMVTVIERFVEITMGIVIAALISQFVLPIHARQHLRDTQAATLRQMRAFYLASLQPEKSEKTTELYQQLDENIALSLIKQRKLAIDSAREPLGEVFNQKRFQQLLQIEKEILRSIVAMQHVYEASPTVKNLVINEKIAQTFEAAVANVLAKIANYIETANMDEDGIPIPDAKMLQDYIYSQERKFSREEDKYLDAFLFSVEMLVENLHQLVKLGELS